MITLETLSQATAQEVFDQVARHLLTQNKMSLGDSGLKDFPDCRYRNDDGLTCAAGCLISEDEYYMKVASYEGRGWATLVVKGIAPDAHWKLIWELQKIHDSNRVSDWPKRLLEVAFKNDLEYTVLKELGYES